MWALWAGIAAHLCPVTSLLYRLSACLFPGAPNAERLLWLGHAVKLCNEAVGAGLFLPSAGILVNKTLSVWLVGISPLNTIGQGLQLFSLPSLRIRNIVAAGIGTPRDK